MSWFKNAKNFDERNVINAKIRYLTDLRDKLVYLSKFVFQSGKIAKDENTKIITSDKITSYPALHEVLIEADALALDSPWKFASLCGEGIERANSLIMGLKKQREEFTRGKDNKRPMKGWID